LYLGLAWLLENKASYENPLVEVDTIAAEFLYPSEIYHLIYYMPPDPGTEPVGVAGLERRWREYVDEAGQEFRQRSGEGAADQVPDRRG
jgi:hypothetical protein